uniref:AAA+ ATPase domain-containing protein n=1 Tax=Biomphalaria glabrata TaxID=6526 RepID=A0A2C9K4Z2_BIOGL
MLKQPESIVLNDFKQQRAAALDSNLISQYEELLSDWMSTIESILTDTSDESITDSLNDTRDKVKYLDSLKRYFDQMYHEATPSNLVSNVIPGFISTIKQMESVSRFYARSGYLGVLLTKVTNQLVQACKDYIKQHTYNIMEDKDELWMKVAEDILSPDLNLTDTQSKGNKQVGESKLKITKVKGRDFYESGLEEDSLYAKLRACLQIQLVFRESIVSLKEALGVNQTHSHPSSISSFSTTASPLKRKNSLTVAKNNQTPTPKKSLDVAVHLAPLADEEAILSHLDLFCNRVRQALEVIQTMAQLNKLSKSIVGIPRPKREELIIEEVQEPFYKQRKPKEPLIEVQEKEEKTTLELDDIQNQEADTDQSLQAIVEGDELAKSEILEVEPEVPVHETVDRKPIKFSVESDENKKKPLTEEELSILKLHYPDCDSTEHDDIEGPNVSTIVEQCMDNMNAAMKHYVNTKTLLDVESKDKEKFDVCFNTFQSEVQSLEKFIAAYLHVIFMRKLTTQQGLDILTKFAPIATRTGLKGIISEKYVEIFSVYEKDLDEVQMTYEKYKTKPILMRNAPPVAGAIFWSRQLLKRIEDPMRIFRDIKAVTSLADYGSQVRTYNKLATALVTFESLWFTQWKNNIEQARSGLKATLFVLHPVTGDIIVNADERILELIHEAKWMTRLDIQIPESAFSVVMQEARFKGYKSHLELVLSDFRVVCQDIPSPLMKLFRPHILNVQQQLQPGLNSLAWNSMNIDAFLHQVHLALDKLKSLNDRVHQVLKDQVFAMISHIDNLFLFDLDTAFSQIWHVEEFTATIRESIKERSALLKQYVDTIVDGLQSIANFLTAKKQQETKFPLKDKKLQLMLSETDHEKERQEAASEQANVLEFITHFKEQVFKAVLAVTTKTLACLADAAGCTGEVIRAFTPTSNMDSESDSSSPSPRPHQGHYFSPEASRGVSAQSGGRQSQVSNRPASNVTNLSDLTWTHGLSPDTKTLLQFEVEVKFSIPNIIVEPTLDIVQKAITDAANAILEANNDLDRPVSQHLLHFSYYNFLWKDDMHGNFNEFISAAPGTIAIKREVERYVSLEKKVLSIPGILPVGPISLFSDPIKDSLHGFSIAWKTKFASVVHEEAKKNLDSAVLYRSNVRSKLEQHVQTLDQLNSVLRLLEELRDMENKIDGIYLPIELMYSKLREFELRLPRDEVEEVDSLRDKWAELLELADNVRNVLLKERRGAFEQELDKQVKVEGYWDECLALPSKLKDWDAYNDLKTKLQMYFLCSVGHNRFNLNEIRNRHWLEVMHVTHSSFQLEANIFKLCHLLDIGLIKHKAEVEEICKGASRELELEIKMRLTEEEWTEQVLNFQHYKKRGPMYLDKAFTERLLEQLEDAEALLATMLTSRYIGPLRDEAASWAEKLKEVAEVLELWLEVQDLWQYLEAVFSNSLAVRELPQEAKRFARIDKGWTKMMKRAFDTRNVLQCCYGGEVPKAVVLRHIHEELEICFKSLVGYLDNKRRAFPRFYFVSDPILLAVLSHPNDLESVKPHLKSFFSAISDVKLEKADDRDLEDSDHDTETRSVQHHRTRRTHAHGGSPRDRGSSTLSALTRSTTPPKIDKRLHQVYVRKFFDSDNCFLICINFLLFDRLNQAIITDCKNGIGLEEWPLKYPSQVCRTGMLYHWTAECELAIADIKYDRKALQLALRKYTMATSKLATVLQRGSWRLPDKSMKTKHRVRLEAMITQSTYLKDILENMCHRKLRETTDFEWRRSLRCYLQPDPTLALQQPVPSASTDRSRQTTPELEPSIEEGGESKPVPRIWILDSHYEYGTEFYGTDPGVSPTPVTEKCFLTMSLALKQIMGSLLVGPMGPGGVGKTETIKGLANILGNFLWLFPLSKDQEPVSLGKIIQGLAMDGCWGCLKESQTLNQFALSVLLDHVQSVFAALKAKQTYMNLGDGSEIPLRNSELSFIFCSRPPDTQHNFSVPALIGILKRASQKRKKDKDDKLAEKNNLKDDMSRSESQNSDPLTSRINQSGALNKASLMSLRKSGTVNALTLPAKQEHAMVCDIIEEIIAPRLMTENQALFKSILKDCFAGLPNSEGQGGKSAGKIRQLGSGKPGTLLKLDTNAHELEPFLEQKAVDAGLIPHKPLIAKCEQLYLLSQIYNGVIVAGPPGTGKSTCIQLMVDALCARNLSISDSSSSMHKLLSINPLVVDNTALMFGYLGSNNEWVDSIFTHAIRKSNRNISTTWICLNGNLNESWADNLNSFLAGERVLPLKNGDKLFLSENIMLLFETDDLALASPATVSSCGILYLDKDIVSWQPIVKSWLDTRSQLEVHVLQRAFQKTLDPVINFVFSETKPSLQLSEVGMLHSCLALLSAMLADNIEVSGELHIERLYLFCLIWTFGGLLDISDRKPFSDLLTTLSTALPDDDRDISVFDYYVDESGEWDPWHSKMSEASSTDNQDFLGEVFVDTIDIIRIRLLMEFSASSGRNVLLVGPHGSGKTSIINEYMNSQDPQLSVCKRLVFSGASTARQLQEFIESNIHHRQGFVYGAKENKKLKVFIDDLNLPLPDKSGTQRCNELLRQLLDEKQLFTTEKPFEWHKVEGLSVMSAMVLNNFPSAQNRSVSQRLLRHFSVFYVPVPQGDSLKSIVDGILKGNMTKGNGAELEHDLHNILVSASCEMLTSLQNVLHQSPMEGRYHYLFTLKDITKCFQCLRRLAEESKADDIMVVSLWRHELVRIVRDGISRMADLHWLDEKITAVLNETWKKDLTSLHENFVTFPVDTRVYQRPLTSVAGTNQVKVSLQPVVKWSDLHSCINTHLTRYNDEFGNIRLNTMLSDLVISHVVRIHRVLSFHHGGNMLLIGAIGSKLSTLCRLALHVADIPIHKIDTSKQSNFFDGLRSAIRLSGSEGKVIGLLFTARDLEDPIYMDAINSLLVSGEYPHLFSNDEMEGLLLAIQPAMKRETSSSSVDPMKFFVSKVKCNLHLLICLHPGHDLLRTAAKNYPGLLTGCQVNWLCDWPQETLLNEASYFISKYQLTEDFEDLRESITTSLANIHSFVLRDCKQIPWAGDVNATVNMTSFKVNEKKKDQLKFSLATVPNLPYSKVILHERIRFNHRDRSKSKNEVYVGPTTYRKFMETFKYLYLWKSGERTKAVEQLKKVISTLDKTRLDAKVMKKGIKTLNEKFEGAQTNTAELLNKLTAKVTALEKLKAKIGLSKSLDAYLQLNEMDVGEVEEEDFFKEEEYDAYDAEFDRMREANLKTRQVQAKDELETQKSQVEQCRANLAYAKQQVIFWRNKVDRGVIEHVRAFSNPPLLVGQIIEMVMVLIGKRLPSQRLVEVKDGTSKMEMSSRMSTSSSGTKTLVKKTPKSKEPGDKFDKTQWKSMQQTMSDSVKFVDMLHNLSWEDGLPSDVLAAVESYLACSKEGQLGVTGEGSLLENAQEKQFQAVKQRSPSPGARTGLTIAGAKYASEDCATLVHYTIAIVEYSRLCGPLKSSIERMHELEREIEENERQQKLQEQEIRNASNQKNPIFKVKAKEAEKPQEQEEEEEEELSEADLPRMQSELSELQALFDRAVVEKHSLEMELQSMNERLKSAVDFIESLKSQESKWRQEVQDNDGNELMLANCITAAATLTYCGPVNIDTRRRMGEFFMQVCEHHGVPLHKQMLFRNIELVDFLYTPLDNISLQRLQLPTTRLMLENACFLIQDASMTAWPLICDPTSRAIDWLRLYFTGKQFVEVKYHEVRSQLENCLADGTPLLVTDCDLQSLVKDKRFINTIQTCSSFINGKSRFKVIVTDHEVECDPKFRMFLHTTSEPHVCPSELAACTSVTFFQQSRADVEEELLDIFMAQEKSRLNNELTTLRQEKQENMEMSEKIECQMKDQLSSDVRLMNDLLATKKLSELRKQFEETQESQSRVLTAEDSIYKARESYRQISQRAAVCFDTTQYLREINGLYQSSFKQFVTVYQTAIAHSERSSMKAVIDRLTYSSFLTAARGLLERDRVVFALLLAIEVEDSLGNVGPGEREFVISPNFSSVVMSAMGSNNTDSHIMQVKKSFDWMTDDQFHNLQILATHFDWFRDMFDRMPKDGRETQWRNLCESDLPENVPLPDRMDDVLKAIHRLCIVRAVRNDRLLQASSNFVSTVLGKKYITDISLDLPTVLRQSSFTLPILLLFRTESELTLRVLQEFAVKKQTKFLTIVLTDNLSDERSVKKQIHRGMTEGLWVLLHNAHNSPRLLNSLESILNEGTDPSDSNFRLWVSSHVDTNNIPVRFLQNSLRLFVDSPKVMKDFLSRSLTWMEPDILRQSNRPDWPAMLHNLCYLHAAIHLRTRFGGGGWNLPHEFSQIGFRELQEAVRFTVGEFKDLLFVMAADGTMVPRTTSWTGIRFMLSEIVYGTHTTDVYDQQALSAIVEYWCTPNAVKKDFEVARLKYRAPAAFFNTNVRLNTLIQSIDSISQYFLEVPEACHLHPNIETLLGDDQYVFTRLNKIFDAMPVSPTLSHKLFPRPPTPFAARASTKFNEIEEEFVPNSGDCLQSICCAVEKVDPLVKDLNYGLGQCHQHLFCFFCFQTLLGDDQYVFTRLNKIFDAMPVSPTLSHKLFPRPPTPFAARASTKFNEIEEEFVPNSGPPIAGISSQSNNPLVVDQGVFSTASYATYKTRKDMELWEVCHTLLQKVPKAYNKEYILEKVKKVGGFTAFNNFIMKELETMYKLLNDIRTCLQAIKNATESETLGDQVSQHILEVADDIYHLRIPEAWCKMSGYSAPPLTFGIAQWLVELQNRCYHFEKILSLGRDKMPSYWLGAFFNPRGLLSLVKQDSIRSYANERQGNFELLTFQTEITSRDKDHLRDPPQDGIFVWGIYLWGCGWDKTTGELQDLPPRSGCASLPVVHVTCWPVNEKPILQDSVRASETYQCPVYHSRLARQEVVLEMDVRREGIPASRWPLRGLTATIRPY